MIRMINWQRMWDDDGNKGCYLPLRIMACILSFFYTLIINFRNWLYDHKILEEIKLPCPVISVGNMTVGGTGKTPCVIMIAQMLRKNGFNPAVISRGYRGASVRAVNIVSDGGNILLDSQSAGDEPYLIARSLKGIPVITGRKRTDAGRAAINTFNADVLVCDDAMQHRQLFRDINLVLVDSYNAGENNHILPRGRLREPLKEIKRASVVLFTRFDEEKGGNDKIMEFISKNKTPFFTSVHKPKDIIRGDYSDNQPVSGLQGKKIFAFCGIARPDSFKKSLRSSGALISSFEIFPDHHRYGKNDLKEIMSGFIACGADYLVTTEKDAMRLLLHPDFLKNVTVLRMEMEIKPSVQSFERFMMEQIRSSPAKKG